MKNKRILTASILLIPTLLVACGGDGNGDDRGGGSPSVDTTAPDSPTIPTVKRLESGKITITGKAEAESTVKIIFPDDYSISTVVSKNGNYSTESSNHLLATGSSIINLTATDIAGNVSDNTTATVLDITPPKSPEVPSFQRLEGGIINVSGKAEANSIVKITFADGTTASKLVSNSKTYSINSPETLSKEASEINLIATDAAGNASSKTVATIPAASAITQSLTAQFSPTVPVVGVKYRTSLYNNTGTTPANGNFNYTEGENVIFNIAGKQYTLIPGNKNTIKQLLPSTATADTKNNFKLLLINLDIDNNASNGIDLTGVTETVDPFQSTAAVNKRLFFVTGEMPKLLYSPSLGINTEAPQGESDLVGQPMPFVDVFRTARPFAEFSGKAKFDANGWPKELDPDLGYAKSKILQGTLAGAIPSGKYTLIYEGSGTLQLGGPISNLRGLSSQQGYSFDITLKDEPDNAEANALNIIIRNITPDNYIKNIQIIMPGGTCKITADDKVIPFIHADSSTDCPSNTTYTSFADRLSVSRNDIIFNPDYLSFLRQFKVIRMMNLTESSHGRSSCVVTVDGVTEIDKDCVNEIIKWDDRSKIEDAVWGGSARTPHIKRNGVPVEVVVSLANTLNRDMWVNMPHSANDEYIFKFAEYVSQNLSDNLKTYIEYSNETWNPGFVGHFYVEQKGIDKGYNTVPQEFDGYRDEEYFARLRYYSRRAVEMFAIWKTAFNGSNSRLVRVLGTNQGDKVLSEQMIKYVGKGAIDAIAMAPYFFGCIEKAGSCQDALKALKDAKTVDDVFDIIDQDKQIDPSGLSGTISKIKLQAQITSKYDLQLLTYEGGQHLTTSVMGRLGLNEEEKATFRALFKKVNRDSRMKQYYEDLLMAWKNTKNEGATLFTLYTLPQTYYRYGNWGLKEHLNKSREESPKFDGAMTFQEQVRKCWWDGCSP